MNRRTCLRLISLVMLVAFILSASHSVKADQVIGSPLQVGNSPVGVAYDSANGCIYVANQQVDTVSVIADNNVVNTLSVGNDPVGVAYDSANGNIYVSDEGGGVSVINGSSVTNIPGVGQYPFGIAYDSVTGDICVTNAMGNSVTVISGNTVLGRPISVGSWPDAIAYDSFDKCLYVANCQNGTVSVYSDQISAVVATITVGSQPNGIAYDSGNNEIYVANSGNNTVSVISGQSTVGTPIPVGSYPYGIAYDSANGNIYVTNVNDGTVSIISGSSTIGSPIQVGANPFGIAYDSGNGEIYVSNSGDGTISTISTLAASVSPTAWTMDVGQSETFTATATGGSGSYPSTGYQWYVNGVARTGQTSSTFTYTPSSTGTPLITATITDSSSTTSPQSAPASVTVNPALSETASASPPIVDAGQSISLSVTQTTGTSPYTYEWQVSSDGTSWSDIASGTNSQNTTVETTGWSTGTYYFQVIITDSAGAQTTFATGSVTVNPALTVATSLSPSATADIGQPIYLRVTEVTGTGPFTYDWQISTDENTWSNIPSYSSQNVNFDTSQLTPGTFYFQVIVTDSLGNQMTMFAGSPTLNPALAATASSSPSTVEAGQTVSLFVTPSGGTAPYFCIWQISPNGTTWTGLPLNARQNLSLNTTFDTSGLTAGKYQFRVIIMDMAFSQITVSAGNVTVNALPSVIISPASFTMNVGQTETFTANPSGGSGTYTAYQWYVDGVLQTGQTASTFSYYPATLGLYNITATVTDSLAFTSVQASPASVTVSDVAPTISAPGTVSISVNALGGASGVVLGSPSVGSIAYSTLDLTVTNNAPSTFPIGTTTVTWTVTDPSGLSATATQTVTVNDVAPTITAPASLKVSANKIGGASSVSLGAPVIGSIAYSTEDLSVTNNATTTFPIGTTTILWTVTDPSGLNATAIQTVTVNAPSPVPTATPLPTPSPTAIPTSAPTQSPAPTPTVTASPSSNKTLSLDLISQYISVLAASIILAGFIFALFIKRKRKREEANVTILN